MNKNDNDKIFKESDIGLQNKTIFIEQSCDTVFEQEHCPLTGESHHKLILGLRKTYFRKFKVALNSMYRIFLNFAKGCVLSCLSNVDNIKKFHRAVFEL